MFCTKCGQMLNDDGICTNENCPSKTASFNETQNDQPSFTQQQTTTYTNQTYSNNQYGSSQQYSADTEAQDLMLFIGEKNTEYFMEKYTRYQQNPSFTSWNWAAFFLNFYWLLYRKMYGYAAAFFGIGVVINLLGGIFASLLSIALYVLVGLFANQLYIKFALNKIKTLKYAIPGMNDEDIRRRIAFNGGTNLVAPLVVLGICILFILIVFIIIFAGFAAMSNNPWYY